MLSKLGCQGNVIVELQITTTLKFSLKTVEKSQSFAVIAWIFFFNEFNGASHTLIQRKISSSFKTVKKSRIHLAKKTYSLPPRQAESNCCDRWGIYEKRMQFDYHVSSKLITFGRCCKNKIGGKFVWMSFFSYKT